LDHFLQILCKFWTFYHLQIQKIFAGREAPHPEVRFEKKNHQKIFIFDEMAPKRPKQAEMGSSKRKVS
jgi:hypothetical protein